MLSRRFTETNARKQPRLIGYYLASGFMVLLFTGLWLYEGYYLFTGWFPSIFDDLTPINGVAAGAFMTLMLVCAVGSLIRPRRIAFSRVLLVGATAIGVLMPLAFVLESPLVMVGLYAFALLVLVSFVWLHPADTAVVPRGRWDLDYPLLGLTVVAAIPFLWMAVELQYQQLTLDDEVADRWFYGGLSMYLLVVSSLAALASVDRTARRFVAIAAAFLAVVLGLVSIVYPTELHSFGVVGGGLVLAWGLGVLLSSRR